MSDKRRILITGGAGFIGSRLARNLTERHSVTVFDNFHPQVHDGNPENRDRLTGVRVLEGDVRDRADLHSAIRTSNPHVVYHLAAETGTGQSFDLPARYTDVNVMGTAHLIEGLREHTSALQRVVLAGSRSVYGEGAAIGTDGRPALAMPRPSAAMDAGDFALRCRNGHVLTPVPSDGDCPVAPASVYASTKLMQEYLLQQAFWGTSVEIGILRLQNVYGPGQSLNNPYTGVISIFTRQIDQGKVLDIYEDGEIVRDFVFVDDVVDAFARIGTCISCPRDVVDIGSGEATTILEVARTLLSLMGRDPSNLRITGRFRPGDVRHAVADISRARTALEWTPTITIKTGLEQFVSWSQSQTEPV